MMRHKSIRGRFGGRVLTGENQNAIHLTTKTSRGRLGRELLVEADGVVRVYDPVAGHYTICHSLQTSTVEEARRLARLVREGSHYTAGGLVLPRGGGRAMQLTLGD